jgi:Fe-S-cluster containining protein
LKTLYNKVRAVEKLFRELDNNIAVFQQKSGLNCLVGCSNCCKNPDVEATILEFIPFAYKAFKEGKADEYYEKFKNHSNSEICNFYDPLSIFKLGGACTNYQRRGLICRLFGFSAIKNKNDLKQIVTCKEIKISQSINYEIASSKINSKLKIPMMNEYYMKLYNIDPNLGSKLYPINKAVLHSLEYVMSYYSFRKKSA